MAGHCKKKSTLHGVHTFSFAKQFHITNVREITYLNAFHVFLLGSEKNKIKSKHPESNLLQGTAQTPSIFFTLSEQARGER